MGHKKTKIVLDADVIIHFIEAGNFSLLPDIFPEYEYIVLDVVYNEVSKNNKTKKFHRQLSSPFSKIETRNICSKRRINKRIFFIATSIGKGRECLYGIL